MPVGFLKASDPDIQFRVNAQGVVDAIVTKAGIHPFQLGSSTNDNATAGQLGEYVTATVATPGASMTTGTAINVTSMSLTPGDWDVQGVADYLPGATTAMSAWAQGISTTTGALGAQDTFTQIDLAAETPGPNVFNEVTPTVRISVAVPITVYLVAKATFSTSTLSVYGTIRARRVR